MRVNQRLGFGLCVCAALVSCKTMEGGGGLLGDVGRRVMQDEVTSRAAGTMGQMSSAAMLSTTNKVCGADGSTFCRGLTGSIAAGFTAEFIERMTAEDLEKASEARQKSIETGEPQEWENPESGASGTVETKPAPPKPPEPTPVKVEKEVEMTAPIMDAVGEQYMVTAPSGVNVRRGPGTEFPVVMKMGSGERFTAIARLQDANWYLVGKGNTGKGYASGDLIGSAPVVLEEKPEPEPVAAAETREVEVEMAAECYTTSQNVTLADGTSEQATVTSCRTPEGWVQV